MPTVTSVSPPGGSTAGGTAVTITGTGLSSAGATTVEFGGIAAAAVSCASATTCSATSPAHAAGVVAVTLTNANGSGSCVGCFTYSVIRPELGGTIPSFTKEDGSHARWAGQSRFVDLAPGQLADLVVRFVNSGSLGWVVGLPGAQAVLGSSGPLDNTRDADAGILLAPLYDRNRYATTSEAYVGPGDIGTFSFRVRAPSAPGTYQIRVRPLIEGVTWLEDQGVYLQITVP